MTAAFFDLRATHNPHRWYLPLTPGLCVGHAPNEFMYGGVGLGSAVAALELTTERPLIWATAQYLSFARPGEAVDLDVWIPVQGRETTQARVISHVRDKEILTVNAALGRKPADVSQCWRVMPQVPPPQDCPKLVLWPDQEHLLHGRFDIRAASKTGHDTTTGTPTADGRSQRWVRTCDGQPFDAALLAIIADYVPSGVRGAMGREVRANSLDNTLRVHRVLPTEWVMCDIRIVGLHEGFGYGEMDLYAETGELMASASQSFILRWPEGKP
jgi:acyl-CoA thioesterase II